jgi:hypothetical protein
MKGYCPWLFAALLTGTSGAAMSQTSMFNELSDADSAEINVTLTAAGVPLSLSQPPVDDAENDGVGASDDKITAETFSLAGLNVLSLASAENQTSNAASASADSASAVSTVGSASLLGGLVQLQGLSVSASCAGSAASDACQGSTTLQGLVVAGQAVPVATPIAPNTVVPVVGQLQLTVGGQPVTLPVNLSLILNEQTTSGNGATSALINVTGAHLAGTASLAGVATLNVDVALAAPVAQTALVQSAPQCTSAGQFFVNGDDASKYYECAGTSLMAFQHTCPAGLLFNIKDNLCDWPDVVQESQQNP